MKAAQVRGMTDDQLSDELVKLKKEQFNLRFKAASGQLEKTARVRQISSDIERLQTLARESRAGEAVAKPLAEPKPPKASKTATKTKTKAEPKAKAKPKA